MRDAQQDQSLLQERLRIRAEDFLVILADKHGVVVKHERCSDLAPGVGLLQLARLAYIFFAMPLNTP